MCSDLEAEMSSSKYFKDSSSFKPEEILKQEEESETGWQSTSSQESHHFEESKPPREVTPLSDPPLGSSDIPIPPESTTEDSRQNTEAPESQPEHEDALEEKIDLSNYVEIAELDKQVEQAYQRGMQDSIAKIDQDYDTATKTLLTVCQQLDEIRNTIINNSSRELQDFALSIAERILRISVAEQDETIIATIEEALMKAVKSDEFTVFVHPKDFDTVTEKSESLVAEISGLTNLIFKKDITVERGGTRIESENCTIDATISSQFETIRETIKKDL